MTSETKISVRQTDPQTIAFISGKGPYSQIPEAMGKLFGWIGQKGYIPAGPPSGVYFNSPMEVAEEELLWEIRCPVSAETPSSEPDARGFGVKKQPSAQVATAIHKGPFHEVGRTYGAIMAWMNENGYQIAGPPKEIYLSDPSSTPPEELLTEIWIPVRKG